MKASRRKVWIRGWVLACMVVGLCLIGVSIASMFAVPFYQQPPAAWMPPPGTVPPGGSYRVPPGTQPPGKIRVRLFAGSLIVANGDFRRASMGTVVLGNSYHAGLTWIWNSPARAWDGATRPDVWKWYFYKEHFQVHLFPIGVALLTPWALRRWVFKQRPEWACQRCGYDRRGGRAGPCPECGADSSAAARAN